MALQPVQVVTYVYGADVNTLDKPALLEALKRVRAEMQNLVKGLEGVESTYVTGEITKLDAAQKLIVALLDK